MLEPHPKRGLDLLQKPSPGDVFYDIEGDPLWDSAGSLEYLHGLWWHDEETGEPVFTPLWAHDREQERHAFEALIEIFISRRAAYPDMHIYHYAPYETTALKRLARNYGTCEEELDDLLRGGVFVDLFQVVRQSLQASVESYSIKSMERFYMEAREAAVKEGGASIVQYELYRELAGTPEGQTILDDIAEYNEEDCRSTYLLYEWLRERRREAIRQFGWVGEPEPGRDSEDVLNASPMSGEPSRAELHRNKLLLARTKLELAAEKEADPDRRQAMRLLAEVLLFNVREQKSMWWSLFEHCSMSDDQLLADGEAIGGLVPVPLDADAPRGERTFMFDPQDFKIRAGDPVRDPYNQWPVGTVTDVDDARGEVTIKLQSNALSELPRAIFPFRHVGREVIDLALVDLADSFVAGSARHVAAERLLAREKPYFGEEMVGGTIKERRELLADMTGSYLVAQGPPGTGKTYSAADLIVDQLIAGKRVGITAGTHLAIGNLCDAVEQAAIERGHHFIGVKKCSRDAPYAGPHGLISAVYDNDAAAPGRADLTAGTPWLFSRPEWRQQLDLIVIDEAGQFALSSALAVGTAAKTMLLVGDPNQLPQVTQGEHPIGSGASALEHVIGEHRTIPRDMGVFLGESWRMTPELCDFVSDTFYEGRLEPHKSTAEYTPPTGTALNCLPVGHEGNRQRSPEEADVCVEAVRELIALGVAPEEIMVVSPYNMQVELLRREIDTRLPGAEAVKVLTVDRCQGQEVDVVIFSMATSGGEGVPRGYGFLFSSNRFNVAISRARRAAYLVASPQLLRGDVKQIEDMRLVDAFIAFKDRAIGRARDGRHAETNP
ncbi:MAG: TM0106 family RecB-like putative nuclease [Solirubrobacterales bacterium]